MKSSFVDAHTHRLNTNDQIASLYHLNREEILSRAFPRMRFWGVGLHPWWLKDLSDLDLDQLWQAIEFLANQATAIGETGIDRSSLGGVLESQKSWFVRHLKLRPSIPLILHNVRAGSDLLAMIPVHNKRRLLLHDYNGAPEETRQWLKRNAFFSFGSALIRRSRGVDSLELIPRDRLLLETDDGHVSIEFLYDLLHDFLKGPSKEELKRQLNANFHQLLGLKF